MWSKQTIAAYTAGYIDGEGWIAIAGSSQKTVKGEHHYKVVIRVASTDLESLQRLQQWWGGRIRSKCSKNPLHRDAWDWQLHAVNSRRFLRAILPFVQIKRGPVEVALRYLKEGKVGSGRISDKTRVRRKELYELSRLMNRRGRQDWAPRSESNPLGMETISV